MWFSPAPLQVASTPAALGSWLSRLLLHNKVCRTSEGRKEQEGKSLKTSPCYLLTLPQATPITQDTHGLAL